MTASQNPTDVGVDDGISPLEGKDAHRSCRIRSDTGQIEQIAELVGHLPAMAHIDCHRGAVQIHRSSVVAETRPQGDDVGDGRSSQRHRGRESCEELCIPFDDPVDLGLLEHELADENRPRVAGAPPGQIPARAGEPVEQGSLQISTHGPDLDRATALASHE